VSTAFSVFIATVFLVWAVALSGLFYIVYKFRYRDQDEIEKWDPDK
jgi:uncharacterized membrane protein HdeD (DUF308 family)